MSRQNDQSGQHFLRAVNIETGAIAWEIPQPGTAHAKTWSGVLATAGGLVFYGQPNGGFAAVDQKDGKTLWQFPTNQPGYSTRGVPVTYEIDGKQYLVISSVDFFIAFDLP